MGTYEVLLTYRVDDPGATDFDVENLVAEMIVETERHAGWSVEVERIDTLADD